LPTISFLDETPVSFNAASLQSTIFSLKSLTIMASGDEANMALSLSYSCHALTSALFLSTDWRMPCASSQ
jgi:hypothetical protein